MPSHATVSPASVIESLTWRYATKKFDPGRTVSPEDWTVLERSLVMAPSSFGLQPWRFVVVTDAAMRARFPAVSWNQGQPRDCSHMVVLAARRGLNLADVDRHVNNITKVRGKSDPLAAYRDMMAGFVSGMPLEQVNAWCDKQVYIALGFLMFACAQLSIDACPMEGIDGPAYDKLLGLEGSGYASVVGCAVGYRAADDKSASAAKIRYSAEELVKHI